MLLDVQDYFLQMSPRYQKIRPSISKMKDSIHFLDSIASIQVLKSI